MVVSLIFGVSMAHADEGNLNILVYGATGKIGSLVVDEALSRGHTVTAVSRDPEKIKQSHQNLAAVKGDLLDPNSIASLVEGKDVVIISVRGIIGKSKKPESAIQRIAVEKVVNVLRDLNDPAPRLILEFCTRTNYQRCSFQKTWSWKFAARYWRLSTCVRLMM
jgi:nucleoside-diphosphate-sugar epimerase